MFVGHALLAFALVTALSTLGGVSRRRAVQYGALAGAFAAVPDVDIVYALVGVVRADTTAPVRLAETFWATGNVVHRGVTHSLVVAPVAALAAATWAAGTTSGDRRVRAASRAAVALLALSTVAAVTTLSGGLAGVVTAAFLAAVLAVATAARRHVNGAGRVFALALFGIASHPFGDLFTGTPPAMLYPFDATLVASRVTLSPDPTLHLLAAFAIELSTAWLAAGVVAYLWGVRPTVSRWPFSRAEGGAAVLPRATLAAGYAASVLVIPAPTLDLSYPFVFSVLAVGSLGVLPRVRLVRPLSGGAGRDPTVALPDAATAALTGLTAITVAAAAYALAYAWLSGAPLPV
ncbi:MAG: metal-dependent hydrolase [Haloferacaceae archaeon]